MAAQSQGNSKKSTIGLTLLIVSQVLVVILVWIGFFSGTDEREARIRATLAADKAASLENAIASYYAERNTLPPDNNALRQASRQGQPYFTAFEERGDLPFTLSVANGVITLAFPPDYKLLPGKTLVFTPVVSGGKLSWSCDASSLLRSYQPLQCRGQ